MDSLVEVVRRRIRLRFANVLRTGRLGRTEIPTAALYFAEPLADLIGQADGGQERPIRREGPTLFTCGDTAVIVRYLNQKQLASLAARRFQRIYLVVDDNLNALHEADGLPSDYRRRLLHYRDGVLQDLLRLATHVVAPSETILANYPGKAQLLLEPAQCHGSGGLAHHRKAGRFEIVFAGTRSHLDDLSFIAEDVAHFLKARPDARLTTFLNGHAPRSLRDLPNVLHLPALSWAKYRAFVAQNRFHAALAPALDTAFNRARSLSKLYDHAAYGAAGLYSLQPPFSNHVRDGVSGLLLRNESGHWRDALQRLAARPEEAAKLAAEGQKLSQRLGDAQRVRAFWRTQLELPS